MIDVLVTFWQDCQSVNLISKIVFSIAFSVVGCLLIVLEGAKKNEEEK